MQNDPQKMNFTPSDKKEIHILLIEDNLADAKLFEKKLLNIQCPYLFDITQTKKLAEASTLLTTAIFDIIITDLSLPDGRGVEIVEKIRNISSTIPLIVSTGLNDNEVCQAALHAGAHDFLVKDEITPQNLLTIILKTLEKRDSDDRPKTIANR